MLTFCTYDISVSDFTVQYSNVFSYYFYCLLVLSLTFLQNNIYVKFTNKYTQYVYQTN